MLLCSRYDRNLSVKVRHVDVRVPRLAHLADVRAACYRERERIGFELVKRRSCVLVRTSCFLFERLRAGWPRYMVLLLESATFQATSHCGKIALVLSFVISISAHLNSMGSLYAKVVFLHQEVTKSAVRITRTPTPPPRPRRVLVQIRKIGVLAQVSPACIIQRFQAADQVDLSRHVNWLPCLSDRTKGFKSA